MQERLLLLLLLPSLAAGLRGGFFWKCVIRSPPQTCHAYSMLVLTNGSGLLGLAAYAKKDSVCNIFAANGFS